MNDIFENIKFDNNGLIPCIVQDHYTKNVLMLAYMNRESLEITINEKQTCFYSRSRKELWRKGETSGNIQHVTGIFYDCDGDTLLVRVDAEGPACHTGNESCFFNPIHTEKEDFSLYTLYNMLLDRKNKMPEGSYTTYLFEKGIEKILKKVGEESTEVIIGAMKNDKKETVYEIADLAYHVLVLMTEMGITVQDINEELASRHVIDKKTKQETMQ